MARKTLFLPIVVFLAFALKHQVNQQVAMTGLVIGFLDCHLHYPLEPQMAIEL